MKDQLLKYIKKPFVRNVAVVASGTAMAQVITMAFAPVITRLYGPEAFGMLGAFLALVGVIIPIAALTYPIAIVLPKEDGEARGIAKLSIYIAFIMAALMLVVILIAGNWVVKILQVEEIRKFMLLVPLIIIFSAWLQVNQQWLIRKQLFKVKAKIAIVQALILNGAKSGIGLLNPVGSVLIMISVFGQGLYAIMLYFSTPQNSSLYKNTNTPTWSLRQLAKKHYDFPAYRAPQMFLNAISQGLPVLMLAGFFGPASAGFYTLGKKILTTPSTLVANAIGDVFYPKISKAYNNNDKISKHIINTTIGLAVIAIVPYTLFFLFGSSIFKTIFGYEWSQAGEYSKWIALWLFFFFINKPSVKALPVLAAQRFYFVFSIFSTIVRLLSITAGFYLFNSDIVSVMLYCISGSLLNILLIILVLKKSIKIEIN